MQLDNPPDANSLTDLIATLLGNVFETLLKKALRFDPVGKTKQSRSTVSIIFSLSFSYYSFSYYSFYSFDEFAFKKQVINVLLMSVSKMFDF